MSLLALLACGLPGRIEKSVFSPDYVTQEAPVGELATVTYQATRDGTPTAYDPEPVELGGHTYYSAIEVSTGGWIEVNPVVEPITLRVYVRSHGINRHDFTPVRTVTGAIDRQQPNEVRFLPERIDSPFRLSLRQLSNVYNAYVFGHGDLLLVETSHEGGDTEHYFFKAYRRSAGLTV